MSRSSLALSALAAVSVLFPVAVARGAGSPTTVTEIPIQNVFVPAHGFDDNDNVEVVVRALLPNTCYKQGPARVERPAPGLLRVRQFAYKEVSGICAEETNLPEHLKVVAPFTNQISAGQLKAGNYSVQYASGGGRSEGKPLAVSVATAPTIDSLPYAMITSIHTSEVARAGGMAQVSITGILPSTCYTLNPEVRVIHDRDVYAILPVMEYHRGHPCADVLVPFEHELALGPVTPGEFLVHVRSMSGKSVNQVFSVQ